MDTPGPSSTRANYSSDTSAVTLFHPASSGCRAGSNNQSTRNKLHVTSMEEKTCKAMPKDVHQGEDSYDADSCSSSCCSTSLSSSSFSSSCASSSSSFSSSSPSSSSASSSSSHYCKSSCQSSSYTSSTISGGNDGRGERCLDDQGSHNSDCKSPSSSGGLDGGSNSFCSCCENLGTQQLARDNIADGETYDEIEDVFKSLDSTHEKSENVLDDENTCPPQPKLTWLKQSTFTVNGTQAIFYLKLLHDSPHERLSDSCKVSGTTGTSNTNAPPAATCASSSTTESSHEPGCAPLHPHQRAPQTYATIDSPRCSNSKFTSWMLKKKSLARVINRSSSSSSASKKNAGRVVASDGQNKSSKCKHVHDLKASTKLTDASSSMNSVASPCQVNKVLDEQREKNDSVKRNGKQSQSASNSTLGHSLKGTRSPIESPTLTTQQLLEQYPNICTQWQNITPTYQSAPSCPSSSYSPPSLTHCSPPSSSLPSPSSPPPRPPKPERFRPGNKSAQGNNEPDDNSSSTSNVLASESSVSSGPSLSAGQTANCNPARVDGWLSYSLTSDQSNSSQAKSSRQHKSQTACTASDVNGEPCGMGINIDSPFLSSSLPPPAASSPSSLSSPLPSSSSPSTTHPASRVTSHEDPLINLLNGCSCCSIDLLAQRLHSNSLMALFLTPLTGHPLVTPAKEEIDPTRPSYSQVKKNPSPTAFYSSSPSSSSSSPSSNVTRASAAAPSSSCHSSREFDCPIQCNSQSIQSSTPPFTKLLLTTDSSANVSPSPCSTSTTTFTTCTTSAGTFATSSPSTFSSTPFVAPPVSSSSSSSSSHQPSNSSSVQRDCLTYLYPDSCSCTCNNDNDDNQTGQDDHLNRTAEAGLPCNSPIKAAQNESESCIREALIAKLKGMFITLCHVTRDITNQLPITCTISLDGASNCSYAKSKCSFDKKHANEASDSFNSKRRGKASTKQSYGGQFNSGHDEADANTGVLYEQEEGCSDEYCLECKSPKGGQSITGTSCCTCSNTTFRAASRKYRVAFIHEFTSILVLAVPEWMDREIIPVTSLITSFSQMIRFSFASLDAAFKNRLNHKFINSYLDLICTLFLSPVSLSKYTSQLKSTSITLNTSSTILSPVMGLVQKIPLTDDELYTEISDKLSEYETKDWTRFDCNYLTKKNEGKGHFSKDKNTFQSNMNIMGITGYKQQSDSQSENDDEAIKTNEVTESKLTHKSIQPVSSVPGGCPGDFLVVGSIFFQKGYLIHSHVPFYFQPDLINFVKVRGLLDLTSRHSCKLVLWQEVHPTGSNKHLIHLAPSRNIYSSQNTKRHGALSQSGFQFRASGLGSRGGNEFSDGRASGHFGNSSNYNLIDTSRDEAFNASSSSPSPLSGAGDADDTFDCLAHQAVDYSAHSGRFFLLAIGIKQTLFTVLLEVPFIFSTEPVIAPNEAIIVQSIRFVISSLQRSGLTDEINDHLLLQSLAQFCHEECLAKCITEEKKSITARTLLKSAKSLRDLLSFSTNDTNNKEETKHSENESRSSFKQVDDLSRTSGTFLRGRTNEPDESVTCVPLVNSLHQPFNLQLEPASNAARAKNKSKPVKGSKEKNSLLKKAQSTPSLTASTLSAAGSHCRQLTKPTNGNLNCQFNPHLASPSSPCSPSPSQSHPSQSSSSHFTTCGTRNTTGNTSNTRTNNCNTRNVTTVLSTDATVNVTTPYSYPHSHSTGTSCISTISSSKSLASEYKERLSFLLPKNVLLFTDVNLKTGTFNSSLLLPLVEEETLSLKDDEVMRMHKRSKCKMNHRLSLAVLSKYREAMICLNRHLDEMPLVKECGLSFVVPSSTQGQRVRTHNEFCERKNNSTRSKSTKCTPGVESAGGGGGGGGKGRGKEIFSEKKNATKITSSTCSNTTRNSSNGDNECHSPQVDHHSQHLNDSLDFSDGFKDGRNNNYHEDSQRNGSRSGITEIQRAPHHQRKGGRAEAAAASTASSTFMSTSHVKKDECNAYSQAGETFSSSCKRMKSGGETRDKHKEKEGCKLLTYEGTCLKATYWVSAYRESPVRTVFACFLLPNNSKHKGHILGGGIGGSSGGKNVANVTYPTTKNNSSSGNNGGGLTMASHETTQRLLDSGLISMESIAYALEVASKDW